MKLIIAFLFVTNLALGNSLTASVAHESHGGENIEKKFIGCRSHAAECVNSCPTRRAFWQIDATKCDRSDWRERFACYCITPLSWGFGTK